MGKSKKEKQQAYFFDNKALLALILPLVVEQFLAVLVGMADSITVSYTHLTLPTIKLV